MKVKSSNSELSLLKNLKSSFKGVFVQSKLYVRILVIRAKFAQRVPVAVLNTLIVLVPILFISLIAVVILANKSQLLKASGHMGDKSMTAINVKKSIYDFASILESEDNYRIYLSVKDEATRYLTPELRQVLSEMGSKKINSLAYRGGYVAVIENKKVVAEEISNKGVAKLKHDRVLLKSAGASHGNFSSIVIGNLNLSPNKRGINLVVQSRDMVLETYAFDFHALAHPRSKVILSRMMPEEEVLFNWKPRNLEMIRIIVKGKNFNKIRAKRKEALELGVLITSKEDYVPAKIIFKNHEFKAKIRLKGDWVDHLRDKVKWSYRIDLKGDNTILGMSKFSIHHPKTRNYIGEWIFHKALKREDIMGLRYSFLKANLEIDGGAGGDSSFDLGIYALEESFEKYLIENNQRRESVIVKINENLLWEGTAQVKNANIDRGKTIGMGHYQLSNDYNMTVLPFSESKVIGDSSLTALFNVARNMFYSFVHRKLKPSELFDIDKLAKYNAITCLLGAKHGLALHNLRLYYNPINARFEPIGFDGLAGRPIKNISFFSRTSNDIDYLKAFARELEIVSSKQYLDGLLADLPELESVHAHLKSEFENVNFNSKTLYNNQKVIKKDIFPSTAFHAFLEQISDSEMILNLRSISPFPIEILNVSYKGKRIISEADSLFILKPKSEHIFKFNLPTYFKNLFVRKKASKTAFSKEDVKDLLVTYRTYGTKKEMHSKIIPWKERESHFEKRDLMSLKSPNVADFDFISVDDEKKRITFNSGQRIIDKDLVIPEGYTVYARQGLSLNIINRANIISYSPIEFIGTRDKPIEIISTNKTGQGIILLGAERRSKMEHVSMTNLSNPQRRNWSVSGAVNFYESPVDLKYVAIRGNRSEDALNIIKSDFSMSDMLFERTKSDAFDGDFVTGSINNVTFKNLGNDAIDVSGSNISVDNVTITKAGDKALSAGENSTMLVNNVVISNCEIAVASKDKSLIRANSIEVINCKVSYTAFQKKSEFGPAKVIVTNGINKNGDNTFLIENRSSLKFNSSYIETQKNVIDLMYGETYGKSSK